MLTLPLAFKVSENVAVEATDRVLALTRPLAAISVRFNLPEASLLLSRSVSSVSSSVAPK